MADLAIVLWVSILLYVQVANIDNVLDQSLGAITDLAKVGDVTPDMGITAKYERVGELCKDLVEARSFKQFILICILVAGELATLLNPDCVPALPCKILHTQTDSIASQYVFLVCKV